ncbi:hypothetical protein D1AOALGA4SA_2772 [Olavius algarvensis Delta 1 endosymbiont]|nr:hypothetical protein D1AOALGA4SA_2772 [Olavius algarvensis Delta 1 endosymbiont]
MDQRNFFVPGTNFVIQLPIYGNNYSMARILFSIETVFDVGES